MSKRPKRKTSKAYQKWRARVDHKNALHQWSIDVRKRDGDKCIICGATDRLNSHHVLDKLFYKSISLELNNGVCLCPAHHKYSIKSAHKNALWWVEWLRVNRPEQYAWCLNQMLILVSNKENPLE